MTITSTIAIAGAGQPSVIWQGAVLIGDYYLNFEILVFYVNKIDHEVTGIIE